MVKQSTSKNPDRISIDLVAGTRPNIVKLAPLYQALVRSDWCKPQIIFLQQHTSSELAADNFAQLGIASHHIAPIALTSGDYGMRFGAMLSGYVQHLAENPPALTVVFGDVDTTLAAAMAAKRLHIPVAHVEAGLRSHDMRMPEELNRRMVDAIADLHLTTCADANDNLVAEGHDAGSIKFVGNLMIDALVAHLDRTRGEKLCEKFAVPPGQFAMATFHRPSNVDTAEGLVQVIDILHHVGEHTVIWWPLHPRTRTSLERHGLMEQLQAIPNLRTSAPIPYVDFVSALSHARLAITDSGGLQEETSWLGIPCLTMRENTERPITIHAGTNQLVGANEVAQAAKKILTQEKTPLRPPIPLWDGDSSGRAADALKLLAGTQ